MAGLHPDDLLPRRRDGELLRPTRPETSLLPAEDPEVQRPAAEPLGARPRASTTAEGAPPWGLIKRFLFRFALVYFLLYALPFPIRELWQLFGNTLSIVEVEAEGPGWEWMRPVNEFLYGVPTDPESNGWWTDLWQDTTTWVGGLSWVDMDVLHQRTGSGDTAHDYLKLGTSTVIALVLALLWSVLLRRPTHYRRTARWLHLAARWYVAFALMGYGMIKFYSGQFPYPNLGRMLTPIGETSPMGLVWTFMGFSKPYEVWVGLGETLAGLLLLSRRTSTLGALIAVAVMSNVAMLNWFYDVPVKLYSSNLLAMSAVLLLPDLSRLWRMFVMNKPVPPRELGVTSVSWFNRTVAAFGLLWIGVHLWSTHEGSMKMMEQRAANFPELYGVWDVEAHLVNGETLAEDDPLRWKWLAMDRRETGWAETADGTREYLHIEEVLEEDALEVAPLNERLNEATWNVERRTATVEVRDPAPRQMADYQRMVEVERPALTLFGIWKEADLELRLVKRNFELERGFHMVQELPYNR